MSETPFISFLVSSYNLARFLPACLDSIVHQEASAKPYEAVVIDDGSTDSSWDIINNYASRYPQIFSIERTVNSGLEKTCNRAVRRARAPFVVRVDADDVMNKAYLNNMERAITAQPFYDFYYCKHFIEAFPSGETRRREVPDFEVEEIFTRGDFFATGTIYIRQQLLELGLFPEDEVNCGLENYNLILRLIAAGKKGLAVPGAEFIYRRHGENMSITKLQSIIKYGKRLLSSYGRPFTTNANHPYGLVLDEHDFSEGSRA